MTGVLIRNEKLGMDTETGRTLVRWARPGGQRERTGVDPAFTASEGLRPVDTRFKLQPLELGKGMFCL